MVQKKSYEQYNRMATATNELNRQVAQFQAHAQFLARVQDVEALEALNTKFASFLDVIKSNYLNSLPEDEK